MLSKCHVCTPFVSFCHISSSSWHETIVISWIWRLMTRRASTSKSWRLLRLEKSVNGANVWGKFAEWQVNLRKSGLFFCKGNLRIVHTKRKSWNRQDLYEFNGISPALKCVSQNCYLEVISCNLFAHRMCNADPWCPSNSVRKMSRVYLKCASAVLSYVVSLSLAKNVYGSQCALPMGRLPSTKGGSMLEQR